MGGGGGVVSVAYAGERDALVRQVHTPPPPPEILQFCCEIQVEPTINDKFFACAPLSEVNPAYAPCEGGGLEFIGLN